MKKKIITVCILLLVLSLAFILFLCFKNTKYKVLEIGGYEYNSSSNHRTEVEYDIGSYENKKLLGTQKTIEYNGKMYTGEYSKTIKTGAYNGEYDQYFLKPDNGVVIQFGINCKTGMLVRYGISDKNYSLKNNAKELNRDECLVIAQDYLLKYIDDASEYKFSEETYRDHSVYKGTYEFTFNRYIGNIKTDDRATVCVTVYGTVFTHTFYNIGQMNDAVVPTEKDMSIIEKNIDEKMNKIYYKSGDAYNFSYKTTDRVLRRMQDGKYALEYTIDVDITPTDSSSHPKCTELVSLIVYLE